MQKALSILVLATVVLVGPVLAQTRSFPVSGTVSDENGLSLPGAAVLLPALDRGTATDQAGRFSFGNVPAGSLEIRVTYLGFQPYSQTVTVDGPVRLEITLSPGVLQAGELMVVGDRQAGEAKALNQQRTNQNITNVVSTDQIGKFPDANIGDALKRIPSITVQYDQGEARFASIRGAAPQLNSVLVNGERIPSAEAEIRTVQVDLVPSDMIQTIEVNKVVTPDMEADAIGGSINLVTRAPSAGQRISVTLGGGYNMLREKATDNVAVVFGNRFLDGRLGVVVSGSWHDNRFGSDNTEGVWTDNGGTIYPTEWDVRRYDLKRTRRSAAASLDFRVSPTSTLYLRTMYNHRDDWENRYRLTYRFSGAPDANGVVARTEVRRQTKGGSDDGRSDMARLEDQKAANVSLSGEHLVGKVKLVWQTAYSRASEDRPDERYIGWRVRNVAVSQDLSNLEEPSFSFVDATKNDPANYTLRELTEENQHTEQNDYTARLDATLPLVEEAASRTTLKAGYRLRAQDKSRDNSFMEYEPIDGSLANMGASGIEDYSLDGFLAGPYLTGSLTSRESLAGLDFDDASRFEGTDAPAEYAAANYESTETVHGFYGMVTRNFGAATTVVAGVRIEATQADYTGNEFNDDTEAIMPVDGSSDYTNVLPSLSVRHEVDHQTILRAAWTHTMARPGFYELVPYRSIAVEDNELSVGNPDLKPMRSMNFDLMAERYFESIGIVSAGAFYKDITDFIYTIRENDAVDARTGQTFSSIFRPVNGASASVFGVEAAIQRRLPWVKGLGVFVNYTYTHSETENPQFSADKIPLPGAPEHSLNTSLNYERGPVDVRVSFNYNSAYIDPNEVDLTPGLERYYDEVTYLDINGTYRVSPMLRVFFSANNLLNQPLRFYAGDPGRTYQAEYYDSTFSLGFKFDL